MIRRGFWLATGVVLGVTGYRRLTRLATELTTPRMPGTPVLPGAAPMAGPQLLAPPMRPSRSNVARVVAAAKFVRDVRDGMAEYRDMHRDEPVRARQGHTLGGQSDPAQSAGQADRADCADRADSAESGAGQQGRR